MLQTGEGLSLETVRNGTFMRRALTKEAVQASDKPLRIILRSACVSCLTGTDHLIHRPRRSPYALKSSVKTVPDEYRGHQDSGALFLKVDQYAHPVRSAQKEVDTGGSCFRSEKSSIGAMAPAVSSAAGKCPPGRSAQEMCVPAKEQQQRDIQFSA
eukprot:1153119-Pelagomonas_calceolata.AAC.23